MNTRTKILIALALAVATSARAETKQEILARLEAAQLNNCREQAVQGRHIAEARDEGISKPRIERLLRTAEDTDGQDPRVRKAVNQAIDAQATLAYEGKHVGGGKLTPDEVGRLSYRACIDAAERQTKELLQSPAFADDQPCPGDCSGGDSDPNE
jgi:hypothetical protein